ncbi:YkgJ family cysteine cluster protein [Desulfobacterota bacterium M19]
MTEENISHAKEKIMGMDKNPSHIMPHKLTLDSTIKFRCHPGVSCFTACCGNINIILTPFDILCLRKRIGIDSDEFLLRYTKPIFIQQTDMPGVQIHLTKEGRCPFVTEEGCLVYTDRPSACRYYPVGMADFHEGAQEEQDTEKFFFLVKEDYCKGHEEDKEWTVREWRADQGLDERDVLNKGWMELVMRRKSFGFQATLSEEAQKMFFMASTNLEKFRDFIFHSSFLKIYDIDPETLDKIKTDDIALLKFSYIYLASSLFGTNELKIKEEKIKERVADISNKQKNAEKNAEKVYEELKREKELLQKQLDEKNKV